MTATKVHDPSALVGMIRAGGSGADVARHYGVSRERVRQIWTRETGERLPNVPEAVCRLCGMQARGLSRLSDHTASSEHSAVVVARNTARFWKHVHHDGPVPVDRPDLGPCWTYDGAHYPTGYAHSGRMGLGYAHRTAYTLAVGPIPEGLTLDHLCRNRGCVNPGHLEAVTHRENILRSPIAVAAINAAKTHCIRGHEFSPENTRRSKNGRACRACVRYRERLARRRRVA